MTIERKVYRYQTEPTSHAVNIFHIYSHHCFFHIFCENCKLKLNCESTKHKSEICKVAGEARKLFAEYSIGYVSSFAHDNFYILIEGKNKKQRHKLSRSLKHIKNKYLINQDVR